MDISGAATKVDNKDCEIANEMLERAFSISLHQDELLLDHYGSAIEYYGEKIDGKFEESKIIFPTKLQTADGCAIFNFKIEEADWKTFHYYHSSLTLDERNGQLDIFEYMLSLRTDYRDHFLMIPHENERGEVEGTERLVANLSFELLIYRLFGGSCTFNYSLSDHPYEPSRHSYQPLHKNEEGQYYIPYPGAATKAAR